jgi:hypothetical protein
VCSYTNTSQGSKTIQVAAVGDTLAQYLLNTNSITVSVVQPIPPTPPVIDDKETKFEGSTGTINIISNRTGKVHWTGSEKGSNIGAVQGEARSGVQAGIEAS